MESVKKTLPPNPRENSNIFSILIFTWTLPLFKKGYSKILELDDIFKPLDADKSELLGDRLQNIVEDKYFEKNVERFLPFENSEYELRISGTVDTDHRIMSFFDVIWGFEVTGGSDQFENLTVVDVKRSGYAFRAGIRCGDIIVRINNIYTDDMTLAEAQRLIRRSGKSLQIFVTGDSTVECDELTVDFWFKPKKKFPHIHVENKWPDNFNWNDRRKPIYKESNCFMVPSKTHPFTPINPLKPRKEYDPNEPKVPTFSADNATEKFENPVTPEPVEPKPEKTE